MCGVVAPKMMRKYAFGIAEMQNQEIQEPLLILQKE